ncbi:MAG: hypothetical protein JW780_07925 [Clostridiales bacterium]|nr:hypothetical protein [Clostridiales bacterium]
MKKKWIWIFGGTLLLVILITAFVFYRKSPYTYVKEERVINYALMGSRSDFELLHTYFDDENRTIEYEILSSGVATTDQYFIIANRVNEYLGNHPDYFLNEGYRITVAIIMNRSGAPGIVDFSNWNWDNADGDGQIMDHLGCIWIDFQSQWVGFDLSEIEDVTLFENISVIIIDEELGVEINIFQSFPNLRYLRQYKTMSDEKIQRLKELLPNCEIVAG